MVNRLKNKIKYRLLQWLIKDAPEIQIVSLEYNCRDINTNIQIRGEVKDKIDLDPMNLGEYKLVRVK